MLIVVRTLALLVLGLGAIAYLLSKTNRKLTAQNFVQTSDIKQEWRKCEQILLAINDAALMINAQGHVEMLNSAAEKLTGWTQKEATGQPYQNVYCCAEKTTDGCEGDPIGEALKTGMAQRGRHHVLLTSKIGQESMIREQVSPLIEGNNQVMGVLCIFRDMTRREIQDARIAQLTFRDSLTGLYNRVFFDQELPRLDQAEHWPLSIIVGDLNGLKLTNDIFGHAVGDELLIAISQAFLEVCRSEDRVFRWGGDEFIVLLPKTTSEEAQAFRERLYSVLAGRAVGPIKLYLPLGCSTKEDVSQDMQMIWQQAEEQMYWIKTVGQTAFQRETLESIVQELHTRSTAEKEHAERVSSLAEAFGRFLGLSHNELRKLRQGGFVHDIGKVALDAELLHKPYPLKPSEQHEMKRHPLVGFRLLNFFEDTVDLAGDVLAHHEQWDGGGYPKGLKGDEIPYLGRILAIIETYDRVLHNPFAKHFSSSEALQLIADGSGNKFDPELAESFLEMMKKTEKTQSLV